MYFWAVCVLLGSPCSIKSLLPVGKPCSSSHVLLGNHDVTAGDWKSLEITGLSLLLIGVSFIPVQDNGYDTDG